MQGRSLEYAGHWLVSSMALPSLSAWGLLFLVSLTSIIPSGMNLTSKLRSGVEQGATTFGGYPGADARFTVAWTLWTTFWSLLVGLVLAVVGGILGGRLRRPVTLADQYPHSADASVEPLGVPNQRQSRAAAERDS